MTATEKRDRWRKLRTELPNLGMQVLLETQKEYIELNIDQLKRGERSTGKKIGRYANPSGWYAKRKFRQNPLAGEGNVDLINLGDWSERLQIMSQGERFEELSRDDKHNKLMGTYGTDVLGLQPDNMNAYRGETFMPGLRKKAAKMTKG